MNNTKKYNKTYEKYKKEAKNQKKIETSISFQTDSNTKLYYRH